jgi:DNA polymerase-3 subunit delta'
MSFSAIKEQTLAVELCRTWLKRQTTHPLLFYGPPGAGKKQLAFELAKALNCKSMQGDACDECLSCRKITNGTHPDVRVIDLAWQAAERKEAVEKQQNLRIETVMTERHRLLPSSVEGTWKVSIISDAHKMTPDAANVLLKILEEPPASTAIILVTPFRDRLFTTIVSRSQPIRFRYVEQELSLSHDELEAHREAEQLWDMLKTAPPSRLVQTAEGRSRTVKTGRPEVEEKIQRLLVPATRALRSGDLHAQAPVRLMQRALSQLRHNVQPALVYDHLLLKLSSARKKP